MVSGGPAGAGAPERQVGQVPRHVAPDGMGWPPSRIDALVAWLDRPPIRLGLLLAGAIFVGFVTLKVATGPTFVAYDAQSYWLAAGSERPYEAAIAHGFDDSSSPFAYRYPPPLIQVLAPATLLPLPAFVAVWTAALFAVFLYLAGRWAFPLLVVFPAVVAELWLGNINLLIALAVVLGFRWPAAWSFVLLTKISPGIGLLWFVFRREWSRLFQALVAAGVIALLCLVLAPGLWLQFLEALRAQSVAVVSTPTLGVQIGLPIRLLLAGVVTWYAARTDRRWLVPVAVTLAAPVIWFNVFVTLLAIVPLVASRPATRLPSPLAERAGVA